MTQSCSRFTCKAVRVLHAKLFAFYSQTCSPFTDKAFRVLRAKLFAFYMQRCSPFTCKAVRVPRAKLFAFYVQGSSIYLTFAILIYNCLTLSILQEAKHFNLTLLVGLLCGTRSCLSHVPCGVVADVVIGVGSILRCYIASGDSASNPGGLVKDLLSKKRKENITPRNRVSSKYALSVSCRVVVLPYHPIMCHEHLQREGLQMVPCTDG